MVRSAQCLRGGLMVQTSTGAVAIKKSVTSPYQWEIVRILSGGTLVLYFRPYFVGISPYISLKNRPYI